MKVEHYNAIMARQKMSRRHVLQGAASVGAHLELRAGQQTGFRHRNGCVREHGAGGRAPPGDLLGCAVAAAVSASFNAPIAGALFALEVVLRHFAVHAFAPIVIASVAGTVINRLEFGGMTEFTLPRYGDLQFYAELPAFLLLGLTCGLVAVILMRGIFWAEDFGNYLQERTGWPRTVCVRDVRPWQSMDVGTPSRLATEFISSLPMISTS